MKWVVEWDEVRWIKIDLAIGRQCERRGVGREESPSPALAGHAACPVHVCSTTSALPIFSYTPPILLLYPNCPTGLRGEMNDRRKRLVRMAFGWLDKDGSVRPRTQIPTLTLTPRLLDSLRGAGRDFKALLGPKNAAVSLSHCISLRHPLLAITPHDVCVRVCVL